MILPNSDASNEDSIDHCYDCLTNSCVCTNIVADPENFQIFPFPHPNFPKFPKILEKYQTHKTQHTCDINIRIFSLRPENSKIPCTSCGP